MSNIRRYKHIFALFFSYILAYVLMIIPLPLRIEWVRPEFLSLVLIYWVLKRPHDVGVFTGWSVGLVMDVLGGVLLGQYAFSMAILVYLTQLLRTRLRVFPLWQQVFVILVIVGLGQLAMLLVQWLVGRPPRTLLFWSSTLTSMILWPWMFRLMQYYERKTLD